MDLQVTHPLNIKFNCDEHELYKGAGRAIPFFNSVIYPYHSGALSIFNRCLYYYPDTKEIYKTKLVSTHCTWCDCFFICAVGYRRFRAGNCILGLFIADGRHTFLCVDDMEEALNP